MSKEADYDKVCRRFGALICNISDILTLASAIRKEMNQEILDDLAKAVDESTTKHEAFKNSLLLYIRKMAGESLDEVDVVQTDDGLELWG